jgi:hypothetical protein
MVFSEHGLSRIFAARESLQRSAQFAESATMTEIFAKNEHHMKEKKPDQSVAVAEKWDSAKGLADKLIQHPANWFNNLFDCK